MSIGTIAFDFDSTIIEDESLELISKKVLEGNFKKIKDIIELTNKGMSGEIDFFTSITERLKIINLNKKDLDNFYKDYGDNILTNGIKDLILYLQKKDIEIIIISGGFKSAIEPFAEALNIPKKNVYALELDFNSNGDFIKINSKNKFHISKVEGVKDFYDKLAKPFIIIGDGYTDYALYKENLANYFIAFIEHIQRENVIKNAQYIANNTNELKKFLNKILSL